MIIIAAHGDAYSAGMPPLEGMLQALQHERHGIAAGLAAGSDPDQATSGYLKFGGLIRATPSLRAHQGEVVNQFADLAAHVLAARAGLPPGAPETRIVATALLGLWRIQFDALRTTCAPAAPSPKPSTPSPTTSTAQPWCSTRDSPGSSPRIVQACPPGRRRTTKA